MRNKDVISPEAFSALLDWLDPDRGEAGKKYEKIRQGLIQMFERYCCADPENLADIAIDRVCLKLPEIRAEYEGDPSSYFYGFGHMIRREHHAQRREFNTAPDASPERPDIQTDKHVCLKECLSNLSERQRDLILDYYLDSKSAKIERRKAQAAELGIQPSALRIRAHRIRGFLEECVQKCLESIKK